MMIVFEGCRNSGKTFLSDKVSSALSMPRYKFDFVGYFSGLRLESKSFSAHTFAIGKELMLMQINRDGLLPDDVIVDRSFLTVLAWGICEGRISREDAILQMELMINSSLLSNVSLVYIRKKLDVLVQRGPKDQWDSTENSTAEEDAYNFLLDYMKSKEIPGFLQIEVFNEFNEESIINTINQIKNVRNNSK